MLVDSFSQVTSTRFGLEVFVVYHANNSQAWENFC